MKQFVCIAALCLAPLSAGADENVDEGLDLMEQGARLLFQGIMSEMEPALKDLTDIGSEMGPALQDIFTVFGPALIEVYDQIDSLENYETPEILPNGDIIIRRSPDAPAYVPPEGIVDL